MTGDRRCQPSNEPTPTPWELIEATEHHGAYIVNSWGRTICDLYAMSNPMAMSVRNGGTSVPVHFDDMAANAAFIVEAVNNHATLKEQVAWWEEQSRQQAVRIEALESELAGCRSCREKVECLSRGEAMKQKGGS